MNYELMVAVYASDLDIAQLALDCGADPNYLVDGNTPLCQAVRQDDFELVGLLLAAGADPNLGCPIRDTGDMKIIERLLDAGASLAP